MSKPSEPTYTYEQVVLTLKQILLDGSALSPEGSEYKSIKNLIYTPTELKNRIVTSMRTWRESAKAANSEVNRLQNIIRVHEQMALTVGGQTLADSKLVSKNRIMPKDVRSRLVAQYRAAMANQQQQIMEDNNEKSE